MAFFPPSGNSGRLNHPFEPRTTPITPTRPVEVYIPTTVSTGWHTPYLNLISPAKNINTSKPPEGLCAWQPSAQAEDTPQVRWQLAAMPLTIEFGDTPPQQVDAIMDLLHQWEVASIVPDINPGEPLVRFQRLYENNPNQVPAITLHWEQETVLGRDYETGHAKRSVDTHGHITHVDITLIETPRIDAHLTPDLRQARFEATILHEFGHALGLEHSQHAADVMYYRGWQNRFLTPNDTLALKSLYARRSNLMG